MAMKALIISAIVLVAVVMGMSAVALAIAQPTPDGHLSDSICDVYATVIVERGFIAEKPFVVFFNEHCQG